MCIAILNRPASQLSKQAVKNSWDNNEEGAGMLYVNNGKLKVFKELHSFNRFYKEYVRQRNRNKDSYFVLHFRISTHGLVNLDNCHPFLVNDDLGFVHNGIIYGLPRMEHFSDTYVFNETILKHLPKGFHKSLGVQALIEHYIEGSKLVFLDSKNNYTIMNEDMGHWNDGNWYSNDSYLRVNDWKWYGNQKVNRTTGTAHDSVPQQSSIGWCESCGMTSPSVKYRPSCKWDLCDDCDRSLTDYFSHTEGNKQQQSLNHLF